jgi:hypothetical protein
MHAGEITPRVVCVNNGRILLVNPLTVRTQPSYAGAVPRYSHAFGLQKDF